MNTYTHEGVTFDLDRTYQDVLGTAWAWIGTWSAANEPLMVADSSQPGCHTPLPFPDVYRDFGPLIPLPSRPTFAQRRAAIDIDPNYAASVAAGFVETPAAFGARIAKPAATIPAAAPLEDRTFRGFLKTLRRTR